MMPPERSALVLVDLQNDFLHPDGAYARGGVDGSPLAAGVETAIGLAAAARRAGLATVATRFTLLSDARGRPLISDHLARLRPFLGAGDFAPGSWGQQTVDALGPADLLVDKTVYSAFSHTPLEWWLRRCGIEHVIVGGIVTNGGVASTVRAAHAADLHVTLAADASAAFRPEIHDATVTSLGSVVEAATAEQIVSRW